MPDTEVEVVVKTDAGLGEGPVWDPVTNRLLWLDMHKKTLHSSDPATGDTRTLRLDVVPGCLAPTRTKRILYGTPTGFFVTDDLTGPGEPLAEVEAGKPGNRMNDGKVDPFGRMWLGTIDLGLTPGEGAFYRLHGNVVTLAVGGLTIPNGLAFAAAGDVCYLVDTGAKCVLRLDLDVDSGDVRGRSTFADLSGLPGVADGMAIDDRGRLWIALYQGGALCCLAPDGSTERMVELPVSCPSSVVFGGSELDTLFVTTGCGRLSEEQRAEQPLAGSVLAIDTGSRGLAPVPFAD